MRLPTGFCAIFAKSSALNSACADVDARIAKKRLRESRVAFLTSRMFRNSVISNHWTMV